LLDSAQYIADTPPADVGQEHLTVNASVVVLINFISPHTLPIFQEFARACQEFHVLVSTPMEPNRNFEREMGSLRVTVQRTFTLQRTWKHEAGGFADTLYVHFPLDTGRLLRKLKPDIILSWELGFRSLASTLYRMRNPSSRLIVCTFMSSHTEQNRGSGRALLRRWLLGRADAVTYNGPECREVLLALGASRHQLFPFGYAAHPVHTATAPVGRSALRARRLLYVGQLSERKGVRPMIDALIAYATKHARQQVCLTVVGEGPLRETLAALDAPGNLQMDLTGNIQTADLPGLIRGHGVLIFPTLADEWGLVVNEALHAGLPVIASCLAQSSNSLIADGVNGWLLDPRAPAEWDRVFQCYFDTDDPALEEMSVNCRQSVAHITPQWMSSCLIEACRQVIAAPGTRR
jgi:glycosyltransferase involved in cell wall biosynthesis